MLPSSDTLKFLDMIAVENFREYLRIPSVHPNINYDECVQFLEKQAASIGLKFDVFRFEPNKPVVIITWIGKEPHLPTIMLNSHMDVVPVFENKWLYKPFDAVMDEDGNIFGRGAQDTKYLGIQYLEAIRRLKQNGFQARRTIHVTFVPDEEIGGIHGMKLFVKSTYFQNLHVDFAIDEGVVFGENNTFYVFNDEKVLWQFAIHCEGRPGHGSLLLNNTAGEKVHYLLNKIYEYRATQKVDKNNFLALGSVSSINVTITEGGLQSNVIPHEFILKIDTRIKTSDFKKFEEMVKMWCKEAGENVWIDDIGKDEPIPPTILDVNNPYWTALKNLLESLNYKLKPIVLSPTSDARYLRALGIPAIGFSPNLNTPFKAHDDNEFLNVKEFLQGIKMFIKILPALADV